jgi:hypothetical protein
MKKILILTLLLSTSLFAKEEEKKKEDIKPDEKKKERSLIFVPGPSYNPQTELGLTLILMKLFKINKEDEISPPSTFALFAQATTNKSWMGGAGGKLFFKKDKWRAQYGVFKGNFVGEMYVMDASRFVGTNSDVFAYRASLQRQVYKNIYLGAGFLTSDIEFVPKGGQPNRTKNTGISILGDYDTKDNQFSATKGELGTVKYNIFREGLGNVQDFETIAIAFRKYISLKGNKNRVLSMIADTSFGIGESISNYNYNYGRGGSQRGYTGSVFEGKNMVRAEAEYKHFFEGMLKERLGLATFAGVGTVYGGTSKVGNPLPQQIKDAPVLPHVGIGPRYRILPKQNLNARVDFAYGREKEFTLYFALSEAI